MKKLIPRILRTLLLSILAIIMIFILAVPVINNCISANYEKRLKNASVPDGTTVIESASLTGKKMGNGNGMQWFGFLLVESDMSREELEKWYSDQVDLRENEDLWVSPQETPKIIEHSRRNFKKYKNSENCYQICLFKNSVAGLEDSFGEKILNFDLRGH